MPAEAKARVVGQPPSNASCAIPFTMSLSALTAPFSYFDVTVTVIRPPDRCSSALTNTPGPGVCPFGFRSSRVANRSCNTSLPALSVTPACAQPVDKTMTSRLSPQPRRAPQRGHEMRVHGWIVCVDNAGSPSSSPSPT